MSAGKILLNRLPSISTQLFQAKAAKKLTFEKIATKLDRNEVWVASIFYGQAKPDPKDITALSKILEIDHSVLDAELGEQFFPDRCNIVECPPRDPLLYRLWEVVANFGYSYKACVAEKFGDGIISAIAFKTSVEKEMVDGDPWVKITMSGKFLPFKKF